MAKQLSLRKLESLRFFLNEAIEADVFADRYFDHAGHARLTLKALDARISELKAAAPSASAHVPRTYCTLPGMIRVGCSCGWYPANAPVRLSQMDVPFRQHRAKLNLPPIVWHDHDVEYADGPYKGMTWNQAYALDGGVQLQGAGAR